jgi:maltose O-acetyltransferase
LKNIIGLKLVQEFKNCPIEDSERKEEIIRELFGSVGVNPSIEHNFHCDLGYNIQIGDNFSAGYNCTILDMAEVRIGENCMIGPMLDYTRLVIQLNQKIETRVVMRFQ